jgi:PPM family protein phosphatase
MKGDGALDYRAPSCMDFLRRVLGLSANNNQPVEKGDAISIVHDPDAAVVNASPELVIEPPSSQTNMPDEAPSIATNPTPPHTSMATAPALDPNIMGTRPLPPLERMIPKPGQRLSFGQLSDVGMVRGNNQDAMLSVVSSGSSSDDIPDVGIFIVADGMGGHYHGEKASAITARIVAKHVLKEIFNAMLEQSMNDPERPAISEILRMAVQEANDAVSEEIPEGGTTVTTTVIVADLAYIAHVGDSRAYLITDEGIEQVTRDHSLVQRLVELGQLTPEEALEHEQRNVLYRAIGQSDTLDVDAITRRLPPRSHLLLCSDGLWNLVDENTMRDIVKQYTNPQDACNQLVKLANERGGTDNITVILIQIPG